MAASRTLGALENDAANRFGVGRMPDPVQNNLCHRALADNIFRCCFIIYRRCQAVDGGQSARNVAAIQLSSERHSGYNGVGGCRNSSIQQYRVIGLDILKTKCFWFDDRILCFLVNRILRRRGPVIDAHTSARRIHPVTKKDQPGQQQQQDSGKDKITPAKQSAFPNWQLHG